jgi:cytochrome P450
MELQVRELILYKSEKLSSGGGDYAVSDMLTSHSFLDARTDEGKPLDREYVKAEILLVMFAGADTTGTAMQGLLHHLIIDEKIHSKVMTEIDAATRAGHLSAMPQYQEVQKYCLYYSAVVKEVMRLDPSISLVLPRIVSKGGMVFDGNFAPEGTEVGMTPALVNRDERIYGKDAAEFRPERWLESEEKTTLYNRVNGTFGWGTRGCLGKELALMEMHKGPVQVILSLVYNLEGHHTD